MRSMRLCAWLFSKMPRGAISPPKRLVPADQRLRAQLVAREEGVLCGEDVFSCAMSLAGPVTVRLCKARRGTLSAGDVLASYVWSHAFHPARRARRAEFRAASLRNCHIDGEVRCRDGWNEGAYRRHAKNNSRACGYLNGMRFAAVAVTTIAFRFRTPCWQRTITSQRCEARARKT